MASAEEFDRQSPLRAENFRSEPLHAPFPGIHEVQPGPVVGDPVSRASGAPLPMGTSSQPQPPYRTPPPPGRTLSAPQDETGTQRAMAILKQAMPFVQKLLPLLEGNVASAIANVFAARPHHTAPVDLMPVRHQVSELQVQQADLRNQVLEQNTAIKRVEDQLAMVREATDRNTLEQQELIEYLKAVANKVNLFAVLLFVMLIVSLVLNAALFLHIKQVLP